MARRLLVLLVPLALLAGACSSDDDPQDGSPETTASSTTDSSASSTTRGGVTSTVPGTAGSTTTPAGPAITLTGEDGSGSLAYSLATDRSEFCYRITVEEAGAATEAHVHRGTGGDTGEVVLNLTPPADDGTTNTCSAADTLLIGEIEADPAAFYVDVHTDGGDLRAQLR